MSEAHSKGGNHAKDEQQAKDHPSSKAVGQNAHRQSSHSTQGYGDGNEQGSLHRRKLIHFTKAWRQCANQPPHGKRHAEGRGGQGERPPGLLAPGHFVFWDFSEGHGQAFLEVRIVLRQQRSFRKTF